MKTTSTSKLSVARPAESESFDGMSRLYERFSGRVGAVFIRETAASLQGPDVARARDVLFGWIDDADERVGINALRILAVLASQDAVWLRGKQSDLMQRVVREKNVTRRRLLLVLIGAQPDSPLPFSVDFLDFCLARLVSAVEASAVRVLCVKLSYKLCRQIPELRAELLTTLELLSEAPQPPSVVAVCRNVMKRLSG